MGNPCHVCGHNGPTEGSAFLVREMKPAGDYFLLLNYVDKPCEAAGFFDRKEDAEEALKSIGAKPDWFATVLYDGDRPGDCEGFAIREDPKEGQEYGRVKRAFIIEQFILKELK